MDAEEGLRRFRACLAESGLVEGVHYTRTGIMDEDDHRVIYIHRWDHMIDEATDRIVHRAMVLADITDLTYEEWIANAEETPCSENG